MADTGTDIPQGTINGAQVRERRRKALLSGIWAVCFLMLVIGAKELLVAKVRTFRLLDLHLRHAAYDLSQDWLAAARSNKIEVVIVDISELPDCPTPEHPDPRQELKDALDAVLNREPAAVAIDIDFSPGQGVGCENVRIPSSPITMPKDCNVDVMGDFEWTDRGGPPFFQYCLRKHKNIFLGVYRRQNHQRRQWLGAEDYASLAASLLVPPEGFEEEAHDEERGEGTRLYMTKYVNGCDQLPSLGQRLAAVYGDQDIPFLRRAFRRLIPGWARQALIRPLLEVDKLGFPRPANETKIDAVSANSRFSASIFLVDFSALGNLRTHQAKFSNGKLSNDNLKGKLIILGNTDLSDQNTDRFIAPGKEENIAGVFWHACAADTLIRGELIQPTNRGAILLDFVLYSFVIVLVTWVSFYFSDKPGRHVHHERIESAATKVLAFVVFAFGTYIVGWLRVIWADFLIVALIVLMHPLLDRYATSTGIWLWTKAKKIGKSIHVLQAFER